MKIKCVYCFSTQLKSLQINIKRTKLYLIIKNKYPIFFNKIILNDKHPQRSNIFSICNRCSDDDVQESSHRPECHKDSATVCLIRSSECLLCFYLTWEKLMWSILKYYHFSACASGTTFKIYMTHNKCITGIVTRRITQKTLSESPLLSLKAEIIWHLIEMFGMLLILQSWRYLTASARKKVEAVALLKDSKLKEPFSKQLVCGAISMMGF